ncbi:HGGxSTG domain-containing protein [Roseovarius sp. 10]|uniref:HGGxSTG domain-containing protein n=1 Tax=Roseovarius sp. 10 TaxID=3080563 RepID=UPI0029550BCD|nr:HGGxSTG domain-containing protein [Roseovarius sp. 10]MDV7201108.1 HGGxSTG domain-containing protein [Roseovarius sp. 10]
MRFIKGNKIGSATRFGPEWAGRRCGARTKAGTACQRPAVKKNGRCTRHGGKSTGPRTQEGLARIAAAQTTHGRLTKEKRAEAKRTAEVGRQIRAELAEIESEAIAAGLLTNKWRNQLD